MSEIIRTRDVILFFKDDNYTVVVDQAMVEGGWPGGQGVKWVGSVDDEFLVTYSDGPVAGFLLWGSDEDGDGFTSMTRNQPHYQFAVMLGGAALLSTSSYERYTLASRLSGPLVPITYTINEPLYFSLRGLWTNEDEQTASGGPLAPSPLAGYVAQVPKTINNLYLSIQTVI